MKRFQRLLPAGRAELLSAVESAEFSRVAAP